MNDANRDGPERLKPLDEFTLADLESIRLILGATRSSTGASSTSTRSKRATS